MRNAEKNEDFKAIFRNLFRALARAQFCAISASAQKIFSASAKSLSVAMYDREY
jgi:hypothetical protein